MRRFLLTVLPLMASGCIGTDFIDEPLGPAATQADIEETALSLIRGEREDLSFRVLASDGSEVPGVWTWSSRDEAIATVDDGRVTAEGIGQTWIDGSVSPVLRDSVLVTVVADPDAVASVSVEGDTAKLLPGESRQFTAVLRNAEGQELNGIAVSWASSNPSVAIIDNKGLATAVANGVTDITATGDGINSLPFPLVVGEVSERRSGSFSGLNGYTVEGMAFLDKQEGGAVLSFDEDFRAQNGPGLYVYLSPEEEGVSGGVSLGQLQSTTGAQNYPIPPTVDPDNFDYVIVYCQPFGVPFGTCALE